MMKGFNKNPLLKLPILLLINIKIKEILAVNVANIAGILL